MPIHQFLIRIVLLVTLFALGLNSYALAKNVALLNNSESLNISPFFDYYETFEDTQTVNDIQSKHFIPYTKTGIHFGFTNITHWLRINLITSQNSNWVLDCSNPLIENIDVFLLDSNGSYKQLVGGCFIEPNKRSYTTECPSFYFSIRKKNPQILLIRIKSQRGFYSKFMLMPQKVFEANMRFNERYKWIFEGMLILVDLCILMIAFFFIRSSPFQFFALHSCLTTIIILGYHESFGSFFTNYPIYAALINFLPYRLLPFTSILVVINILPIKISYPNWLKWVLYVNLITTVGLTIALTINYHWLILKIIVWHSLLTELLIIILLIDAYFKRIQFNYLIAFSFFLSFIGFFFLQLRLLQFIDYDWINTFLYGCEIFKIIFFVLLICRVIINYERERILVMKLLLINNEPEESIKFASFLKNSSITFNDTQLTSINSRKVINDDLQKLQIQALDLVYYIQEKVQNFKIQNPKVKLSLSQDFESYTSYFDEEKLRKILVTILNECAKNITNEGEITCNVKYNVDLEMVVIEVANINIVKKKRFGLDTIKLIFSNKNDRWLNYEENKSGYFFLKELVLAHQAKLEFSETYLLLKRFKLTVPIGLSFWENMQSINKKENSILIQLYQADEHESNNLIPILPKSFINEADKAFIQRVEQIIEDNLLNRSFAINNLADELNISSVQLRRKLKIIANITTVEFIRNYRLKRAADLLKNRSGNISDVAFQVGFESLSYFTKVFQEFFGKSPSEWMKDTK